MSKEVWITCMVVGSGAIAFVLLALLDNRIKLRDLRRERLARAITEGRKRGGWDSTDESVIEAYGTGRPIRSHRAPRGRVADYAASVAVVEGHVVEVEEPPPAVDPFAPLRVPQIRAYYVGRVTLHEIGDGLYAIGPHWRNPLTAPLAARQLATVDAEATTDEFAAIVGTRLTSKGEREADLQPERRVVRAEEPFDPSRAYQPELWAEVPVRGKAVGYEEVTA